MFRRILGGMLDIVYPKICLACKGKLNSSSVEGLICKECWQKIKKNTPPFCRSCGRGLKKENFHKSICPACQKTKLYFDRAFSPCVYEGVIKELIGAFKYRQKEHLGPVLSGLMTEFVKEFQVPIDFVDAILPVPLHKARSREREFNQAEVLGACIAKEFHKPVVTDILERTRSTETQTRLDPQKRFLNVRGSFSIMKPHEVKGKNILLVDDVLTTGATSSEAALALKQAGSHVVFVLTLAN